MASNNPPSPWVWDYENDQYVRWDHQRRCWVDERNRPARPPQTAPPSAAPPPPARGGGVPSAASKGSGRPAMSSGGTTSSIEDSLRQMTLGGAKPKPLVAQGYTTTASDERTGAETVWDITETRQYEDPRTKSTRSLNVKRIRQPQDAKRPTRSVKGFQASADPMRDYRPGRVIEVALVPPNLNTTTSALSQITPSPGTSHVPQRTRYRRFVIVRTRPQGRNSFEALAIKTYNGLGVSAQAVIKSHHTIIHTSVPPPTPLPEELPVRRPNGQMEDGMQAMPIRVQQFDRTTALDPRARLDYMDTYEFDFGVTNIRMWGTIHPDSEAAFYAQYNHVWAMVMGAAAGPGPGAGYGVGGAGDGRVTAASDTASTAGTVTAERPGYPHPVKVSSYGTASKVSGPSGAATKAPASGSTVAPSGAISDQAMTDIIRRYQDHARKNGYPIPGVSMTREQIHSLAVNASARAVFLKRIKEAWDDSDESASGSESE